MSQDSPKSIDQLENALMDIAVESWRLMRLFTHVIQKLDAGDAGKYLSQLRYFQKQLEARLTESGLTLVSHENQQYDPGMAATPLNLADFGPDDILLVDQMVEPIIIGPSGLKKQGVIRLRKMCT
ncbi:MAG: hypothetical protein ACRECH_08260 [Nitrososphaerales archaeon]